MTIATTNADGSMRGLSDILADCRGAFSKLSESEKANAAESLVGKNAMSGFLALMNAAPADIAIIAQEQKMRKEFKNEGLLDSQYFQVTFEAGTSGDINEYSFPQYKKQAKG